MSSVEQACACRPCRRLSSNRGALVTRDAQQGVPGTGQRPAHPPAPSSCRIRRVPATPSAAVPAPPRGAAATMHGDVSCGQLRRQHLLLQQPGPAARRRDARTARPAETERHLGWRWLGAHERQEAPATLSSCSLATMNDIIAARNPTTKRSTGATAKFLMPHASRAWDLGALAKFLYAEH